MTDNVLEMFKLDLGITSGKRDAYFNAVIENGIKQLQEKGVTLDENNIEDIMLASDFSSYLYRTRGENAGIPKNLQLRIRNRIIKKRAGGIDGR